MGFNDYVKKRAKLHLSKVDVTIDGDKPWDIQVQDKSIYTDIVLKGSLGFGDGYTEGKWDAKKVDQLVAKMLSIKRRRLRSVGSFVHRIRNRILNSQIGKRAFHVGEKHYDLGNDMYELMLGESMGYSCGIYLDENDDLTQAQYNKFDALCQKLKLKPGMKVLEIGAGWGTFARHAAQNYGVEVVGLTVSKEQKEYAENICEGLPVSFVLTDYQKLDRSYDGYFDRVVSIEMIEAVGKKNFKKYFQIIERSLKDDGLVGIQAIVGTGEPDPFLSTRIFPNGLVPSQQDIVKAVKNRLRVLSWDSFGKDYDRTLMEWEKNFRKNWNKIKKFKDSEGKPKYDEQFYRMWRYYLLCCAGSFRVGHNDDCHIILSKPSAGAARLR